MLGVDGRISECTGENLFIVRDGVVVTPPPSEAGALSGVTQASVVHDRARPGLHGELRGAAPRRPLPRRRGVPHRHRGRGRADRTRSTTALVGDGGPGPITRAHPVDVLPRGARRAAPVRGLADRGVTGTGRSSRDPADVRPGAGDRRGPRRRCPPATAEVGRTPKAGLLRPARRRAGPVLGTPAPGGGLRAHDRRTAWSRALRVRARGTTATTSQLGVALVARQAREPRRARADARRRRRGRWTSSASPRRPDVDRDGRRAASPAWRTATSPSARWSTSRATPRR